MVHEAKASRLDRSQLRDSLPNNAGRRVLPPFKGVPGRAVAG
jgi:hypothetical protein